jgi:hypothetical protein
MLNRCIYEEIHVNLDRINIFTVDMKQYNSYTFLDVHSCGFAGSCGFATLCSLGGEHQCLGGSSCPQFQRDRSLPSLSPHSTQSNNVFRHPVYININIFCCNPADHSDYVLLNVWTSRTLRSVIVISHGTRMYEEDSVNRS